MKLLSIVYVSLGFTIWRHLEASVTKVLNFGVFTYERKKSRLSTCSESEN